MKSHVWGIILILLSALAYAPVLPSVKAQPDGCMMLTTAGYAPDADCDGIIDQFDNCQYVANADQTDMNRNGLGDACDVLIEEITVNPDNHLKQGEFAHITVRLMNNRQTPMSGITVAVRNKDLGADAVNNVDYIPTGETATTDFWIKIPKCASVKNYPLSISATFKTNDKTVTESQSETLYVDKNTLCGSADGPLDNTIISVFNQLDIDQGQSALLPVSITNLGDKQATYELGVQDLGNWGTWRIDPSTRMTLTAGHQDTANLYLQTEQFTQAGTKDVLLTVTSGNQKTIIPIKVYVRAPVRVAVPFMFIALQMLFILLLLALIVAAIVIAVRHSGKRKNGHHKIEPYYDDEKKDEKKSVSSSAAKVNTNKAVETKVEKKAEKKTRRVAVEDAKTGFETYY